MQQFSYEFRAIDSAGFVTDVFYIDDTFNVIDLSITRDTELFGFFGTFSSNIKVTGKAYTYLFDRILQDPSQRIDLIIRYNRNGEFFDYLSSTIDNESIQFKDFVCEATFNIESSDQKRLVDNKDKEADILKFDGNQLLGPLVNPITNPDTQSIFNCAVDEPVPDALVVAYSQSAAPRGTTDAAVNSVEFCPDSILTTIPAVDITDTRINFAFITRHQSLSQIPNTKYSNVMRARRNPISGAFTTALPDYDIEENTAITPPYSFNTFANPTITIGTDDTYIYDNIAIDGQPAAEEIRICYTKKGFFRLLNARVTSAIPPVLTIKDVKMYVEVIVANTFGGLTYRPMYRKPVDILSIKDNQANVLTPPFSQILATNNNFCSDFEQSLFEDPARTGLEIEYQMSFSYTLPLTPGDYVFFRYVIEYEIDYTSFGLPSFLETRINFFEPDFEDIQISEPNFDRNARFTILPLYNALGSLSKNILNLRAYSETFGLPERSIVSDVALPGGFIEPALFCNPFFCVPVNSATDYANLAISNGFMLRGAISVPTAEACGSAIIEPLFSINTSIEDFIKNLNAIIPCGCFIDIVNGETVFRVEAKDYFFDEFSQSYDFNSLFRYQDTDLTFQPSQDRLARTVTVGYNKYLDEGTLASDEVFATRTYNVYQNGTDLEIISDFIASQNMIERQRRSGSQEGPNDEDTFIYSLSKYELVFTAIPGQWAMPMLEKGGFIGGIFANTTLANTGYNARLTPFSNAQRHGKFIKQGTLDRFRSQGNDLAVLTELKTLNLIDTNTIPNIIPHFEYDDISVDVQKYGPFDVEFNSDICYENWLEVSTRPYRTYNVEIGDRNFLMYLTEVQYNPVGLSRVKGILISIT